MQFVPLTLVMVKEGSSVSMMSTLVAEMVPVFLAVSVKVTDSPVVREVLLAVFVAWRVVVVGAQVIAVAGETDPLVCGAFVAEADAVFGRD